MSAQPEVTGTTPDEPGPVAWSPDLTEFGPRLALVRQRMGWNVKEAALACGLPDKSWGNWESGTMPRDYMGTCQKIHLRTGVDLTWLALGPDVKSRRFPHDPFGASESGATPRPFRRRAADLLPGQGALYPHGLPAAAAG